GGPAAIHRSPPAAAGRSGGSGKGDGDAEYEPDGEGDHGRRDGAVRLNKVGHCAPASPGEPFVNSAVAAPPATQMLSIRNSWSWSWAKTGAISMRWGTAGSSP